MARPGDDGGGDEVPDWDVGVGGTPAVLGEVKEVMRPPLRLGFAFSFRREIDLTALDVSYRKTIHCKSNIISPPFLCE